MANVRDSNLGLNFKGVELSSKQVKKCNYIFDFLTEQFLDLERRSINHKHESDHEYLLKSNEYEYL